MKRRLMRHFGFASITTFLLAIAFVSGPAALALDRLSIVSAYLCLVSLGVALMIGPIQAIHTGQLVINVLLRRDFGIWAALVGIVHLLIATEVTMNVDYQAAYVNVTNLPPSESVRSQLFGWGSISGYLVGLIFLLLLALSNNGALRLLGVRWWKRLQRTSYLGFVLTVAHGLAFQMLESRDLRLVAVVLIASVTVFAAQLMGVRALGRTPRDTYKHINTD